MNNPMAIINREVISTQFSKQTNRIIKIAAFFGAVVALGGAYTWYINNFWKPTVVIKSVDYEKGIAQLVLNGKDVTLLGDTSFSASGNWAVKFGTSNTFDGSIYDRIELTKFGNVIEYLANRPKTS